MEYVSFIYGTTICNRRHDGSIYTHLQSPVVAYYLHISCPTNPITCSLCMISGFYSFDSKHCIVCGFIQFLLVSFVSVFSIGVLSHHGTSTMKRSRLDQCGGLLVTSLVILCVKYDMFKVLKLNLQYHKGIGVIHMNPTSPGTSESELV